MDGSLYGYLVKHGQQFCGRVYESRENSHHTVVRIFGIVSGGYMRKFIVKGHHFIAFFIAAVFYLAGMNPGDIGIFH